MHRRYSIARAELPKDSVCCLLPPAASVENEVKTEGAVFTLVRICVNVARLVFTVLHCHGCPNTALNSARIQWGLYFPNLKLMVKFITTLTECAVPVGIFCELCNMVQALRCCGSTSINFSKGLLLVNPLAPALMLPNCLSRQMWHLCGTDDQLSRPVHSAAS